MTDKKLSDELTGLTNLMANLSRTTRQALERQDEEIRFALSLIRAMGWVLIVLSAAVGSIVTCGVVR
jgi:hypothetical protein